MGLWLYQQERQHPRFEVGAVWLITHGATMVAQLCWNSGSRETKFAHHIQIQNGCRRSSMNARFTQASSSYTSPLKHEYKYLKLQLFSQQTQWMRKFVKDERLRGIACGRATGLKRSYSNANSVVAQPAGRANGRTVYRSVHTAALIHW
jgi:hypothetical protein